MDNPVFVVTAGRSGSTALCSALGRHPQILMAPREAPWIAQVGEIAGNYINSRYQQTTHQLEADSLRRSLKQQCYTSAFGPNLGFSYNPARFRHKNSVVSAKRHLGLWGAKTFPSERSMEGLLWLYPNAKFIYLFRNGLEVVHSMSKFGEFAKLDFTERCRRWSGLVFWWEFLRHHSRVLTVRHEDFLNDNSGVLERIYCHLGIPLDLGPTEYASSTLVNPLDEPTVNVDPKKVLGNRKSAYEDWNDEQRSIFISECAEAMRTLGYEIPF